MVLVALRVSQEENGENGNFYEPSVFDIWYFQKLFKVEFPRCLNRSSY